MKNTINWLKAVILAGITMLFGLGCTRVEPGYVGIKVDQWGEQKGVQDFPLKTGLVWYIPFRENIYIFPTFMQNAVWDRDISKQSPGDDSVTFNSVEGAIINADLALAYTFVTDQVPHIFVEFRQEPDIITHGFMKNEINNAFNRVASRMKAADIFGEKKQELLDNVKTLLNTNLGPKGFKFELISFHGGLRVDESVQARINAVLEASQRALEAETKVKQATAEANQKIETAKGERQATISKAEGEARATTLKAEAQAAANDLLSRSLTPLLVQYEALQKWNGLLPSVVTSGAIPLLNVSTNR
jgi:regulator of protease activity HflC (stomatin/prohibitin superfamily)